MAFRPRCRSCPNLDRNTLRIRVGNEEALCRVREGGPSHWEYVMLDHDWCSHHPLMVGRADPPDEDPP